MSPTIGRFGQRKVKEYCSNFARITIAENKDNRAKIHLRTPQGLKGGFWQRTKPGQRARPVLPKDPRVEKAFSACLAVNDSGRGLAAKLSGPLPLPTTTQTVELPRV